jgi:hypothetical protein
MEAETLIDLIDKAGYEARSYSGRGMYGRRCIGVEIERNMSAFRLAAQLISEFIAGSDDMDDIHSIVEEFAYLKVSEDSMGRGSIIYFEDVEWPEGRKDSDDEDDEDETEEDSLMSEARKDT